MAFAGMMMTIMGQPTGPPPASNSWTLNNPIFNNDGTDTFTFPVGSTNPQGVSFSTTGDVFFTFDRSGNSIEQFDMTTNFDLGTTSFTQDSTLSQTNPQGGHIQDNGTDIYFVSGIFNDSISRDTAGSSWDITTTTGQTTVNIRSLSGGLNSDPRGLSIAASNAYVVQASFIYEYDLSASFPDVNLASYTGRTDLNSLVPGTLNLQGILVKSDGTKLFTVDSNSNVSELSMSTPYDSTTVSHIQTINMSSVLGGSAPATNDFRCIYIDRSNGDYLFIGNFGEKLYKFDLSQ